MYKNRYHIVKQGPRHKQVWGQAFKHLNDARKTALFIALAAKIDERVFVFDALKGLYV